MGMLKLALSCRQGAGLNAPQVSLARGRNSPTRKAKKNIKTAHLDHICARHLAVSASGGNVADPGTSANVAEAKAWIAAWRIGQRPSKLELWKMCIKPQMYTVAISPMVIGAALAYYVSGTFATNVCSKLLLGGILVIAWLNIRFDPVIIPNI
jgi:hypothetical protein